MLSRFSIALSKSRLVPNFGCNRWSLAGPIEFTVQLERCSYYAPGICSCQTAESAPGWVPPLRLPGCPQSLGLISSGDWLCHSRFTSRYHKLGRETALGGVVVTCQPRCFMQKLFNSWVTGRCILGGSIRFVVAFRVQQELTGVVGHYFPRNLIVRDPNWEADLPLHYPKYSTEDNTCGQRLAQPAVA